MKNLFYLIHICLAVVIFVSCSIQEKDVAAETTKPEIGPDVAIAWNHMAYTIANQHDQFLSFIGVRALAMSHLAMHDALNAIYSQFEPMVYRGNAVEASPLAAASQAAYEVLATIYPDRKDTLDVALQNWLARENDLNARSAGGELGKATAASIIQLRKGDGHEKNGGYTPMNKPGAYQYTPNFDWVWKPDFSYATPFTLDTLTPFRSPKPPGLSSIEYTDSYNEVRLYGGKESAIRTEDQTNIAHWWAEFGEHGWNRIGRITAEENNLSLWKAVRMFALINVTLYDLYLVSFESKYHYDTWRPITAIHNADNDKNWDTRPDAEWQPEMLPPPWPEYPSAHAAVGAAGAEIVAHVYGPHDVSFTMESVTARDEGKVRTYTNLRTAAKDCADSRIFNGFHFRFATFEGLLQGKKVAKFIHGKILRPVE